MKMSSDSDKTKPRDITKHISDKLFAARCNKYEQIGTKTIPKTKLLTVKC